MRYNKDVGLPVLHVRWSRSYDPYVLAAQIAGQLGIGTTIPVLVAAPLREPIPAASDGLWHPIPISPAPLYGCASMPASAPNVSSSIAPVPIASSHSVCGQCQAGLREGAKFCAQCGAVFTLG